VPFVYSELSELVRMAQKQTPIYWADRAHRSEGTAIQLKLVSMRIQVLEEGDVIAQTWIERSFPRNKVALAVVVAGGKVYEIRTAFWPWNQLSFAHPN
jgi:hypothetical protein